MFLLAVTSIHDLLFAIGVLILTLALAPAIYHRAIIPPATCALTAAVILSFAINYATLRYWFSAATQLANALCWLVLLWFSWRARRVRALSAQEEG
jgi:ascorbate-specific PTS system EIIC-type component UlaA